MTEVTEELSIEKPAAVRDVPGEHDEDAGSEARWPIS
jgi:hypothetical protein